MVCVSCSQPLPEGARFCSFCGHEVRSNAVEERRVVTVLFADLVGYTALSEHVDPERVKRVVEGAFQPLIDQIERFGGRVDKVLGDGILALFGAPVAHEDDPDRAIRAAIEMHAALDGYVGEVGLDQQLQLRIGINTGEVVVGTVSGTDDYTAMGDVVTSPCASRRWRRRAERISVRPPLICFHRTSNGSSSRAPRCADAIRPKRCGR